MRLKPPTLPVTFGAALDAKVAMSSETMLTEKARNDEILATATGVLGSREAAERWMEEPAIGLEQRRPSDLLSTSAGADIVRTFLERLQYGVYT